MSGNTCFRGLFNFSSNECRFLYKLTACFLYDSQNAIPGDRLASLWLKSEWRKATAPIEITIKAEAQSRMRWVFFVGRGIVVYDSKQIKKLIKSRVAYSDKENEEHP